MPFRLPAAATPPPKRLPLFPLPALLLPRSPLHLNVFEPRYLAMTDHALAHGRLVGMVQPRKDESLEAPSVPVYGVGCAGVIMEFNATSDGRYGIVLVGLSRFRILSDEVVEEGFRLAEVDWSEFEGDSERHEGEVDREALLGAIARLSGKDLEGDEGKALREAESESLLALAAALCPLGIDERQALLEAPALPDRVAVLLSVVAMNEAGGVPDGGGSVN